MPEAPQPERGDPEAERLAYVLGAQRHCDAYLPAIADPAGKRVVVVGCGAGTEMLWALRNGAREVVGLDIAPQSPAALAGALAALGIASPAPYRILRQAAEEAASLGERFDLVLSNNVFEHLRDLSGAFRACAALAEPARGRIAIFTDPLYWSSTGSHLPHSPWEHLLVDPEPLRARLVAEVPEHHALRRLALEDYLLEEITLNRMRLADFVAAAHEAGLVFLHLSVIADRNLAALPGLLEPIRRRHPATAPGELALEGIAAELIPAPRPHAGSAGGEPEPPGISAANFVSTADRRTWRLLEELAAARDEAAAARAESAALRTSRSFRLGRALTAPARWLRDRLRAGERR